MPSGRRRGLSQAALKAEGLLLGPFYYWGFYQVAIKDSLTVQGGSVRDREGFYGIALLFLFGFCLYAQRCDFANFSFAGFRVLVVWYGLTEQISEIGLLWDDRTLNRRSQEAFSERRWDWGL